MGRSKRVMPQEKGTSGAVMQEVIVQKELHDGQIRSFIICSKFFIYLLRCCGTKTTISDFRFSRR
jgi:hypothetical protein